MTALTLLILVLMTATSDAWSQRRKTKAPSKVKTVQVDYTTFNTLLPLYIDAKASGRDFTAPLTGIVMDYAQKTPEQKKLYRASVINRGGEYLDANNFNDALAMVDLYRAFNVTPEEPYAMEAMSFIRATKGAFVDNDSTTLKQEILYIDGLKNNDNPTLTHNRLEALKSYLQYMRDYIPTHNSVSGTWIANLCDLSNGYPVFIMDIEPPENPRKDMATYRLHRGHAVELGYGYGKVFKDSALIAQEVLSFGNDSIYCVWSSESLKTPSPELNMLFRSSGMTFSNALSQKLIIEGGGDLASSLTGSLMDGLISAGVDAIADAIFNPSKKSILLQVKMRKLNDRVMEGDIYFSGLKMKSGAVQQRDSTIYHTFFTKVEPSDSLFFLNCGRVIPVIENQELTPRQIKQKYSWEKVPGSSVLAYEENHSFNRLQFAKQLYLTQRRVEKEYPNGSETECPHLIDIKPVLGLNIYKKAQNVDTGVIIGKPTKGLPAHLAGLKKGDCITHIDGFPVNSWDELKTIISRCTPYKDIELTYIRGKKTSTILIQPALL